MLRARAIRYAAGLKQLESCRDSFRHLKILGYTQYTYKKLFYMQKKSNCIVNKQVYIMQEIMTVHNLRLYNSKPLVAGCLFDNNIKQVGDNIHFKKELKDLKGC